VDSGKSYFAMLHGLGRSSERLKWFLNVKIKSTDQMRMTDEGY